MGRARAAAIVAAVVGCAAIGSGSVANAGAAEGQPASAPSEAKAQLKELKPGFVAVDLSEFFNNDAFTSENDRSESDFDPWRQSFAAEELPPAGTFEPKGAQTLFLFPAKEPGRKNNVICKRQRIPLGGKAKEVHLLTTANDGEQEEKLTIEYADGGVEVDLKVSDWCQTAQFREKEAVVCPSRVAVDSVGMHVHAKEKREIRIWLISMPLDPSRELKSLKLPNNPFIHFFAVTLVK